MSSRDFALGQVEVARSMLRLGGYRCTLPGFHHVALLAARALQQLTAKSKSLNGKKEEIKKDQFKQIFGTIWPCQH